MNKQGPGVKVKICGITNQEDALAAIEFGADALGFNLWRGSKRYLDLRNHYSWIEKLPTSVLKIAVMVNPAIEEALGVFELPYIDIVQFHGDETSEFCEHFTSRKQVYIKAIALKDPGSCEQIERFGTPHILLDAYVPGEFGGTGKTIDWDLAAEFVNTHPKLRVLLSGGLTPENVAQAVGKVRPYGVDVASGVERMPGLKDHHLMKAFISAAKGV